MSGRTALGPGRVLRALVLLTLVSMLAACGFHLRGALPLPEAMAVTRIEGTPLMGELGRALSRTLQTAGAQLTDDPKVATTTLVIQGEQFQRRVISVDRNGQANAYELDYRLSYSLRAPDGHFLVPAHSISLVREYTFDPNNVLAKGNEEAQLRQDMIGFAVRQMLRQLQTVDQP